MASWNDRVLEEEASRPADPVDNPDMIVEDNTAAPSVQSDVNLPDVSGDLNAAHGVSHIDPEPAAPAMPLTELRDNSYAGALRVNLPDDGDGYVTDEEQRICERRVMSMSELERENFHPLNVTPERPCTAYFNVGDNSTTTKDIFDALLRDGIPATAVRCLQRQPNGSVLITFSTSEYRDRFLRKSAFVVRRVARVSHPASRRLTFVNVYDAPHELPDSAIRERLSAYGRIYSIRRGKCQEFPDVFNGVRHLRMALTNDIPLFALANIKCELNMIISPRPAGNVARRNTSLRTAGTKSVLTVIKSDTFPVIALTTICVVSANIRLTTRSIAPIPGINDLRLRKELRNVPLSTRTVIPLLLVTIVFPL